jgi:PTS system cellobiose-specific IIC component
MIKNSFDLLIPVLVVVLTLYPLSLVIQSQFDMLIPQAIMAIFKPLVSAADSLPAILLAVLIGHLLWFAGIHGAAIVSGMLQMFWLTNLGMNQSALAQVRRCRISLWKRSGRSSLWLVVPARRWGW